jgi:RNA polymerase primary sigma factor
VPSTTRASTGSQVGVVSHAEALTSRQELALVVAADGGDADASRKLIEVHMPAIAGIALRFPTGAGIELQELLQQGVVGLLFAARRFDPRLNTPFWAYASFWVRKAMQELVAELTRPVALSDRAVRALAQIRSARREYLQAHGTEPTDGQLSDATGFTLAQLESLRAAERAPAASKSRWGPTGRSARRSATRFSIPSPSRPSSGCSTRWRYAKCVTSPIGSLNASER